MENFISNPSRSKASCSEPSNRDFHGSGHYDAVHLNSTIFLQYFWLASLQTVIAYFFVIYSLLAFSKFVK
jgi:hypothetical protein